MLSEIKLDDTFTSAQFSIKGFFVPHRLGHYDKGGGILLYVRETLIVFPLKNILFRQILRQCFLN